MTEAHEQSSVVALVDLLTEVHIACSERGHEASAIVHVPTWGNQEPSGELELVSVTGPFPVRVVVTFPWEAATERALASVTPHGSLAVAFYWERVPAPEWEFRDIPTIAGLLRTGMEALPGCHALTIEIPVIFDDTSWGLGTVELRHDWQLDLADLTNVEARATALERIAAHAIDGLRWLSYDHQVPTVPLVSAA